MQKQAQTDKREESGRNRRRRLVAGCLLWTDLGSGTILNATSVLKTISTVSHTLTRDICVCVCVCFSCPAVSCERPSLGWKTDVCSDEIQTSAIQDALTPHTHPIFKAKTPNMSDWMCFGDIHLINVLIDYSTATKPILPGPHLGHMLPGPDS